MHMDKHLEKKRWLFVRDELYGMCSANAHPFPVSFVYFLSVLPVTGMSTQYALRYHRERENKYSSEKKDTSLEVLRHFQELV